MSASAFLDIAAVFGFRDAPVAKPATPIDADTVISGSPWEKTDVLYADARGELTVGIWESSAGAWRITTEEDEYVRLLQGSIRIVDETGNERLFGPGDSFFVPERFRGTWENVGDVRKIFVSLKRQRG